MEVIPAIDLKEGLCIRLYQGDFTKEEIFSDSPSSTALRWVREGAKRLHVVDLDGALMGRPLNLGSIRDIIASVDVPIQMGGGIRDLESAEAVKKIGVDRVVLGTIAAERPEFVRGMIDSLGSDSVVVSVDARGGMVAVRGWNRQLKVDAGELIEELTELGVSRFIYTDIDRDGTMTEPNFLALTDAVARTRGALIASGGVSKLEHITQLQSLGVEGVVIGKALYSGALKLDEIIQLLER